MAKISNVKRLMKEDFKQDDQELVDKLAYVINPFLDQVINNDNLSREFVTATVINTTGTGSYNVNGVATGGDLTPSVQIKTKLTGKIIGVHTIYAINLTNPGTYPINAPWISWSSEAGIVTINKVTGIQDGSKYTLVMDLIS